AFERGGRPVRRAADVGALLREAVDLAGAGSHMRIDLDVPPDLWLAEVDHGQFGQVVSNLIINAQQATSAGGRLRIRASNFRGDPMTATSGAGQRHVRIDFTDNGVGIPDDVRDHVFDPYFTTKVGGSGLGLATAFAICRNHGGALSFRSRVGAGTEFRAFFPASNATSVPAEPTTAAEPSGEGAILVLEDDAPIRDIYRRMLERWGFRVETVADGEQAVALHSSHLRDNTPFDLVIVDLTIPGGMGGRQALHAMRSQAPGVRAIVASGYSDDPTMANHRAAGFVAALAKPFTRAELAAAVNAAMSADVNGARAAPAPRPGAP
ncbi:MAG: response regulator, partial [Planctomycetes bacterium]|nr:response regulator [Planctomycetota bacterium]